MRVFDAHSDLWEDVDEKHARGLHYVIRTYHEESWQEGGIKAGFYPIWVNPEGGPPAPQQAVRILKHLAAEVQESQNCLRLVTDYQGLQLAQEEGKQGIILGAEGLSFLDGDSGYLELLYFLGMREASLTWNEENDLATGPSGNPKQGLTPAGKQCLKRMQQLGMIVDLAHTNEKTYWDSLEISTDCCIISHGNSQAICPHRRNYSDDQLKALAEQGGVIGVCAYPLFLHEDPRQQTIDTMVAHIEHLVEVMGIDHVGFGFDLVDFLDDRDSDPTISVDTLGFESIRKTPNLLARLSARGYRQDDLEKLCWHNFVRVIRDVL